MVILNYSLILNKRNRTLDGLLNLKWNLAEYVVLMIILIVLIIIII